MCKDVQREQGYKLQVAGYRLADVAEGFSGELQFALKKFSRN